MEATEIKYFIEAAMLAAGRPLSIDQLRGLFDDDSAPDKSEIREALGSLKTDYEPRGITIGEVASGYRMQVRPAMCERLGRLWEERPPRYSRALFETLALIAYRQPMTRGEIEEIRGVTVSTNIIRTLQEREWVRVVGHRDVPGRPAMFGTTREFLDYFGLTKLDDLPPLADLSDWESLRVQLNLPAVSEEDERGESADIMPLPLAARLVDGDVDVDDGDEEIPGSDDAADDTLVAGDDTYDASTETSADTADEDDADEGSNAATAEAQAQDEIQDDDEADEDESLDQGTGSTAVRNG